MIFSTEQLQKKYPAGHITAEEFMADFMPHITNLRHLRYLVGKGEINITLRQLHCSKRAPYVIFLDDLARFLNERSRALPVN